VGCEWFKDYSKVLLTYASPHSSAKYKVNGIPSLVLVDGNTGELITTEGRQVVSKVKRI
jgi:hypothetical protein